MESVNLEAMSVDELEAALRKKKASEIEAQKKAREEYEQERDQSINYMIANAIDLSEALTTFKKELHQRFDDHQKKLQEYGGIRSNSKGGFSLISSCGSLKAVRSLKTQPTWDERSEKALSLINDFLLEKVKKADQKHYVLISGFIQKNNAGDLDYQKVMQLLTHKDLYKDSKWVEGLRLLEESYSVAYKGFGYEFYKKNDQNQWQKIEINFTSI